MSKITFNFKQGDYIDCSELSTEQIQMILDRMWELGVCAMEEASCYTQTYHNLIWTECGAYFTRYRPEYFLRGHGSEGEVRVLTWEDIIESSETETVKRVKTIDLERKTKKVVVNSIKITNNLNLMQLESLIDEIYPLDMYDDRDDSKAQETLIKFCEGKLLFTREEFVESDEQYEARVQREKELNDMYSNSLQVMQKELLKAQTKIRELEDKL